MGNSVDQTDSAVKKSSSSSPCQVPFRDCTGEGVEEFHSEIVRGKEWKRFHSETSGMEEVPFRDCTGEGVEAVPFKDCPGEGVEEVPFRDCPGEGVEEVPFRT